MGNKTRKNNSFIAAMAQLKQNEECSRVTTSLNSCLIGKAARPQRNTIWLQHKNQGVGQGGLLFRVPTHRCSNFWNNKKRCVLNECTIKVCVSCSWWCPGISGPSATNLWHSPCISVVTEATHKTEGKWTLMPPTLLCPTYFTWCNFPWHTYPSRYYAYEGYINISY